MIIMTRIMITGCIDFTEPVDRHYNFMEGRPASVQDVVTIRGLETKLDQDDSQI